MAVPGRRKRGRPRRRRMDLAREDMERVGAKEGDEVDREKWKILSRYGDPEMGEAKRRSDTVYWFYPKYRKLVNTKSRHLHLRNLLQRLA